MSQHVLKTRIPLLVNENLVEETREKYGAVTLPGTEAEKSALWVPLIVGSEGRGLLELVDMDRENAFSDLDVRLLQTIANSMSVALENARLFDETQRLLKETEERNRGTRHYQQRAGGLASKLDMQAIYDLVGEKICEIFDAQIIVLGVRDPKTHMVNFPYVMRRGKRDWDEPMPQNDGLELYWQRTRQPFVVNENLNSVGSK